MVEIGEIISIDRVPLNYFVKIREDDQTKWCDCLYRRTVWVGENGRTRYPGLELIKPGEKCLDGYTRYTSAHERPVGTTGWYFHDVEVVGDESYMSLAEIADLINSFQQEDEDDEDLTAGVTCDNGYDCDECIAVDNEDETCTCHCHDNNGYNK